MKKRGAHETQRLTLAVDAIGGRSRRGDFPGQVQQIGSAHIAQDRVEQRPGLEHAAQTETDGQHQNEKPTLIPSMCGRVRLKPKFTPEASSIMLLGPGVMEVTNAKSVNARSKSKERNMLPVRISESGAHPIEGGAGNTRTVAGQLQQYSSYTTHFSSRLLTLWLLTRDTQIDACFACFIEVPRLLDLRIRHQLRLACLILIK